MIEEQVIDAYKKTAVDLLKNPDDPEALANQFVLLTARGERTGAHLALAKRCEAVAPDQFIAVFNLASAQMRAGHYQESIATFERALGLSDGANQNAALTHLGLAHYTAGDLDTAIKWYDRAKALKDGQDIRQSIAIAKLMRGDLAEGMFEFECLFHQARRKPIAQSGIPRWMGESLEGKTLIVAHEQGFGDTIQFSRFIPQLKAKRLIWSGPDALAGLIASNFTFDEMIGEDGPFEADFYCSPISACGALGIEYKEVSGKPYMASAPINLPPRGKIKIGLAWAGNIDYAHDADRSIALEELMPLLEVPGTAFYSLQVGRGESDITKLGLDGMIANLGGTLKNWTDTARAISALDLLISVDSGAAHLAGALGKPCFTLLPYANCWRWMLKSPDTPWYDSMKLFRQDKPRDWSGTILQVKSAVEELLNG